MRVGEKLCNIACCSFRLRILLYVGHRFIRSHTNQSSVLSHAHPRDRLSKCNDSVVAERVPNPKGTFTVSGQLSNEEIYLPNATFFSTDDLLVVEQSSRALKVGPGGVR